MDDGDCAINEYVFNGFDINELEANELKLNRFINVFLNNECDCIGNRWTFIADEKIGALSKSLLLLYCIFMLDVSEKFNL